MRRFVTVMLTLVLGVQMPLRVCGQSAMGRHGVVASVNHIASEAGIAAMKKGGNAIDAAVATALTLGVVNGFNSGIGGGCFILIHKASGENIAIDGRETAPAAATRDMFIRDGHVDEASSQLGPLASGVPGEIAAMEKALQMAGKLTMKDLLLPAAKVAKDGFVVDKHYAGVFEEQKAELRKFPSTRKTLLKKDGSPYKEGDLFRQPDLAKTYRAIAEKGSAWFYGGPFAKATAKWMKANHGLMTIADLKGYAPVLREPISTDYRGYKITSFPPPSSGGVHVLEILNMLATRDFADTNFTVVDRTQFIAESMKLAFADRAYWLGDPAFTKVPRGLISAEYARGLASKIDLTKASTVPGHNVPMNADTDVFSEHTTHLSTADEEGNWVAMTATVNTHFGSKVVIPGTGVIMNNEMDDFTAAPGATNHFGLTGAAANCVAPGKRPLSSMSPTLVFKDGQPVLSVGAAGGPTIISQTVLNIVDVLDLKMDAQQAVNTPKFHQQWKPDELVIERKTPESILEALRQRGQNLRLVNVLGAAQAVGRTADGQFLGAGDPRSGGQAAAW